MKDAVSTVFEKLTA